MHYEILCICDFFPIMNTSCCHKTVFWWTYVVFLQRSPWKLPVYAIETCDFTMAQKLRTLPWHRFKLSFKSRMSENVFTFLNTSNCHLVEFFPIRAQHSLCTFIAICSSFIYLTHAVFLISILYLIYRFRTLNL